MISRSPRSAALDIILSHTAGEVTGSVLDDEGKPLPFSTVALISADGSSPPVKQAADENGSFRFLAIRPGAYKLFAWEEADDAVWQDPEFRKPYEDRAMKVTVGPGETKNAQIGAIAADGVR